MLWRKSRKGSSVEKSNYRVIDLVSEAQWVTTTDRKAAEILLLREYYREGILQLQSRVVHRLKVTQCEDGIYRRDLRMTHAVLEDSAKTPILLLPKHQLTKIANSIVQKCTICRRQQRRPFSYPKPPDLPSQRKFITPLPPLKGGFYERLVESVKLALKKTLHRQTTVLWPLQTIISETESTLITRPITPVVTNTTDSAFVLRPIDLINPYFTPISTDAFNTSGLLSNSDSHEINISYILLQDTLNRFWDQWQKEYLQALAERNQKRNTPRQSAKSCPKTGDVVLIKQKILRDHIGLLAS
ncbi:unnamed protein product [Haemonchus placei]|uniref:DUF5641 domain-containing protein n=1 Tax=Haemonchus placei TaxID=6290 RepID=A0A0N4X4N7_HAEPC|nr:unnamed protein product [Haemonchus placei]